MKKLRVLLLVHPDLIPPESSKGYSEQEINVWKTEYDVVTTLRAAGHEVRHAQRLGDVAVHREPLDDRGGSFERDQSSAVPVGRIHRRDDTDRMVNERLPHKTGSTRPLLRLTRGAGGLPPPVFQ